MPSIQRHETLDNAWRIHDAQVDWTGKVDAKATFAFGLQSAAVATLVAFAAADRLFSGLRGWWLLPSGVGVLLVVVGALLAAMVVMPRLRARGLKGESDEDHIYFGHLQHLDSTEIERRLRRRDIIPVLSRQIGRMSRITWKKHLRVMWSIRFGTAGGLVLAVCGVADWWITNHQVV